MAINIACNVKDVRASTCGDAGNSYVSAFISFTDTVSGDVRKLYSPVYGDFSAASAYLFDLSGNSITVTYSDSDKTRAQLEDLLVDCCVCADAGGTLTSFSAEDLSPLFNTNVTNPTTTPNLEFTLLNCNQYQVFGRVAAGTGLPSYVTLNPIAFSGLAIPNREVVFGTGSGVGSHSGFKYTTSNSVQIGTGTVTGTYSFNMGAGTNASSYVMNIGGGTVNNQGSFSLIISNTGTEISGTGSAGLSVLVGGNDNKIIAGSNAWGNVIMGASNTITSTKSTTYNRILGIYNTITDADYCNILGVSNNITASGAYTGYFNNIIGYYNNITTTSTNASHHQIIGNNNTVDSGGYVKILGSYCNNGGYTGVMLLSDGGSSTLTATANHQLNARFYGGYLFMQNGTTQWMAIAPTTGYVTINNIPTASTDNLLISNGGVVSTRLVSTLPFTNNNGTVTSVAATVTPSTALTVSGSPITTTGTLAFTWTGTTAQYVRGDGTLQTFPTIPTVSPSALTRTDDTNITLTLTGTPATALLQAVNIAAGWNGVLAYTRGGTGLSTLGTAGQVLTVNATATGLEYKTPSVGTSLWQIDGSAIEPISNRNFRTNDNGGTWGYVLLESGYTSTTGNIAFYKPDASSVGYIGQSLTEMQYHANLGYHRFRGKEVKIDVVNESKYLHNVAFFDGSNVVKYRNDQTLYNDFVLGGRTSTQTINDTSTWTKIGCEIGSASVAYNGYYQYNSSSYNPQIPRGDNQHWVVVTIEYEPQTTGFGTPEIHFQIRMNGGTSGVRFGDFYDRVDNDIRTITFQAVVAASGSGWYDIDVYANVTSTTGDVNINKMAIMVRNAGYQGL